MANRDNTTMTASIQERLEEFRSDPSNQKLYRWLRDQLRKHEQHALLAELHELRAPLETEGPRAAEIWAEAARSWMAQNRRTKAMKALEEAVYFDPTHVYAADTLADIYIGQGRYAETADLIEDELEELGQFAETLGEGSSKQAALTKRRAERHRFLARLWDEHLGRMDRTIAHWQRAWHLEPTHTESLEAARSIYASLGDDRMVARLYQSELDLLGESGGRKRRAVLQLELGRLGAKSGDYANAAQSVELSLRLDADSMPAREVLAEIYTADPMQGNIERAQRACALLIELGEHRLSLHQEEDGVEFLRRARAALPGSIEAISALEKALYSAERWEELDALYLDEYKRTDGAQRVALLKRRLHLYEKQLEDSDTLEQILVELSSQSPPHGEIWRRLREFYREAKNWSALAAHIEAGLPAMQGDRERLCQEILELVTIVREHMGNRDRAAQLLHHVLRNIDPTHEEALARYSDHFRERRDWRGLADVLDFSVESARAAGMPVPELIRRLEDIAQIAELRLGDIQRAIQTWNRIQELEPRSPKPGEAVRRLMSRAKMWESLVGVLEQEASIAQTPAQRAEALRRIAKVYRERQVNPHRAISLYEEVVSLFPDDRAALQALRDLYEREGDKAGLANTVRRQLDVDARAMGATDVQRPGARDWPMAQRSQRLTALRRLMSMYERVDDTEGVIFACTGILEILPGDRDALDRMESALEKAGDMARLEQTLEYHVSAATGPAERAKVLRRLARIALLEHDEMRAMERWEKMLEVAPNDREALENLSDLYERHRRFKELAKVLGRLVMPSRRAGTQTGLRRLTNDTTAGRVHNRVSTDAGRPRAHTSNTLVTGKLPDLPTRIKQLERYANVVDKELSDVNKATQAWEQIIELDDKHTGALAALARLYEQKDLYAELADVLGLQAAVYKAREPKRAAQMVLERAQLLEERLGAPAEAIKALEDLLRDLDPANLDTHEMLCRLYESQADFEAALRIGERQLYLATDTAEKIVKGMSIGILCRDQLGSPHRALQAFERVLAMDSEHAEALDAAAELYQRVEDWASYVEVLKRQVALAPDSREKRELMTRVAQTMAERLEEPEDAFEWYRMAHRQMPDATTMADLRRAAEDHNLWAKMASVYEEERERLSAAGQRTDRRSYVNACRELAALAERRLDDPKRAINVLYDAISVQPRDTRLLSEAERLAQEGKRRPLWQLFLECLDAAIQGGERNAKVALHIRKARILEDELRNQSGALEELLQAFAWAPERDETRKLIYELAGRTNDWNDVVAIESALLERSAQPRIRLQILRRKAVVLEDKLNERVRAFRTHLTAFLIAPESNETVSHLWRLAREIGPVYPPADRTPRSEPPAAYVHPQDSGRHRMAPPPPLPKPGPRRPANDDVLIIESTKTARADQTMDLSLGDLRAMNVPASVPKPISGGDTTEQIDLNDIDFDETVDIDFDDDSFEVADSTIELSVNDLMSPPGDARPPAPPPGLPGLPGVSRRAAPPPPSRPSPRRPAPPAPPPIKRVPIPHMPLRAYESPWDELAAAYEFLPAPNMNIKQRALFRIAEIWETGASNVNRAFNTLARALDLNVDDTEARARLNRLAAEHDAWDNLAELYETAAEEAKTGDRAIDLLMDVAEIHAHRGRGRQTEAIYRRVLGMRPDDALARERLEVLYRAEERWLDLCASLEERTNPRLGTAAPESERPELLRELADIYHSKLGRTHDAIDALHRLRELSPQVSILRELGELYGVIGRWSKVIEMLGRVSDLAEGTTEAREALRQIGEIYKNELELPDRAIVAYSQLVAAWPDDTEAHAALDTLYEAHSRWQDLADILRRRAALNRDPAKRASLLRRRASVLMDKLDAFEEAAAALRHARTLAPDAPGLGDELVRALTGAGRAREAAAVLEGRIAAYSDISQRPKDRSREQNTGDLAALYIRLATIQSQELSDPISAKANLERALKLVPDHPTALATLARIVESQEDPRTYAEAKLREAEALDDVDAKVEALMKAGVALRDRCGDIEGARAAFEHVLRVRRYHADATWALAGLVQQGGDLDQAAQVLEKRLEDKQLDPVENARIKTQLAAIARQAGISVAAERHLSDALRADPGHLPAIVARADLFAEAERWEPLLQFLDKTIPSLKDADDATLAELYRRKALALERLSRDDDAYQVLMEADRLHRGNLLVKLALGENRYRSRRWREAALHLGGLAMHVDAPKHPAEVAEGLYHAALAEIRALRPEKAKVLYERALDLKPNYAPALHAMAELAMEEGEHDKAADLLTRQAAATEEPAERMRLFEALGDMSLETLGDHGRALMCYESAVNAASPLESKHVPLLVKLLHRQEGIGEHRGAAKTSELLASFGVDAQERAAHFTAAAENYLAADDRESALAAAHRAVEADPTDLDAVTIASELLMDQKQHEDAAVLLGRALSGDDKTDNDYIAARKAKLWNRLAHARLARGDTKGSASAFDKSIALAPDSDGALDSRRQLLRLWNDDPKKRDVLLGFRRIIAADSMALADVVNYARALCRGKHDDGGRALLELAEVMGHRMGPLDIAFLERRPVYKMAADEAYRNSIKKSHYNELVLGFTSDDQELDMMRRLLATIFKAASVLWPDADESLERCSVINPRRVSASDDLAAAAMFPSIVNALDLPATVLYTTDAPDAPDIQVVCVAAPVVVVGPRLQVPPGWDNDVQSGEPTEPELRFLLARAAEMTRPEHIVGAGLPYADFTNRTASVLRTFGPEKLHHAVPTDIEDEDIQRVHDEVLKGDIPVKLRTELEELLENASPHDLDINRFYSLLDRAADRAGLLLCGDITTAVRHAGELTPDNRRVTRYLMETPLRERYLRARARLGVGVR